jgi:hypothetical protein
MSSNKAQHQLWQHLPSVGDISETLPAHFTDELLRRSGNASDWLTKPNSFSLHSSDELNQCSHRWKQQLAFSPGALRLQLEGTYSDEQQRQLYAIVSRSLGYLNNRYGYFFDVKDRGLDYTKEAIPVSKTKAETGYHTDSTAKHYLPDVVGLLCLQPALSGGESLITNAANLLNFLEERNPAWKDLLHTPLCRDVITPGTVQDLEAIRANDIPLFQYDQEGGVTFRYMRYWIESALEKLKEPTPAGLTELLDSIDSYFAEESHAMCFLLDRGDMLFVNNHFLCHNRTAFVDGDVPRVYVRAWINEQPQD